MSKNLAKISKYLSLLLRHKPEEVGLNLDENGWADIDELIKKSNISGLSLDRDIIQLVVDTSDKKRFSISIDGNRIRANQGHSIEVDLKLTETAPPKVLFHGTAEIFIESIMRDGLLKMKRHHVHLTENAEIARQVGSRYGKLVLLSVDADSMVNNNVIFYRSENDVWLVDKVEPKYLKII